MAEGWLITASGDSVSNYYKLRLCSLETDVDEELPLDSVKGLNCNSRAFQRLPVDRIDHVTDARHARRAAPHYRFAA